MEIDSKDSRMVPAQILSPPKTPENDEDSPPPYSFLPPDASAMPPSLQSSGVYVIPYYCPPPLDLSSPPPYSDPPASCSCVSYPYLPLSGPLTNGDVIVTGQPSWTCVCPAKSDDHMRHSILSLFLCLPLGLVALFYSMKTRASNKRGDAGAAEEQSRKSYILNQICRFGVLIHITWLSIVIVRFALHTRHATGE